MYGMCILETNKKHEINLSFGSYRESIHEKI